MNRAQRRATAARDRANAWNFIRRPRTFLSAGDVRQSNAPDPSKRYLTLKLRPMTIADLIPGYIYEPGRSILEIDQQATANSAGFRYCVPLDLPPAISAPTPENAASAYSFVCATDPEAAAVIERMKRRASAWGDVVAAQGLPQEHSGPIITPPTSPIAPAVAMEVSQSRN